jgi:hypothetical protein
MPPWFLSLGHYTALIGRLVVVTHAHAAQCAHPRPIPIQLICHSIYRISHYLRFPSPVPPPPPFGSLPRVECLVSPLVGVIMDMNIEMHCLCYFKVLTIFPAVVVG